MGSTFVLAHQRDVLWQVPATTDFPSPGLPSKNQALGTGVHMPNGPDFWRSGLNDLLLPARPVTMLKDFRHNRDAHPISTRSGRIDVFSKTPAGLALAGRGHPTWFGRAEWLERSQGRAERLHRIFDQPVRRRHSQLDASPHSKAGKIKVPVVGSAQASLSRFSTVAGS